LKFLVIAALFALLLLLLYSRIYPYLQFLKKILGVAKTVVDSPTNPAGTFRGAGAKTDGKLVRCVACGTWIPAERAIGNRAGLSVYCSRECVEKESSDKERKIAG
jgi:predicted transcriptional regulator with HTH domain